MSKESLYLFGGSLMASTSLFASSYDDVERRTFTIRQPPRLPDLRPSDFIRAALRPRRPRRASGKDRTKIKAARRQRRRQKA